MTSLVAFIALAIGIVIGYFYRDMKDRIDTLVKSFAKKEIAPTITMGAYSQTTGTNNMPTQTTSGVGLISAKTPQRLEWEASQRLEREVKLGISK